MIDRNKPKILILGYYLPGYKVGGPLVSILNIVKNLSNDFTFKVLTPERDFGEKQPYPNIKTNKWLDVNGTEVYYVPVNVTTPFVILKQIRQIADAETVIYINSVFNFFFAILVVIAKKFRLIKIDNLLVSPRGELFDEALGFKNKKKTFFLWFAKTINLYKNVVWHATTENEKAFIVQKLGVDPENIRIALIMASISDETSDLSTNDTEGSESLNIIFLARVSKDKNIGFALDILSKVKVSIVFDIYGTIEDEDLWRECQEKIKGLPSNITVNYKGVIHRDIVKKTLQDYDLFFLPTFAENFGHAIAESLSVGTPVLISDNTPWRNLEADNLGWDINLGNPEAFLNVIQKMASCTVAERREIRKHVKEVTKKRLNNPDILNANKNLFRLPFH